MARIPLALRCRRISVALPCDLRCFDLLCLAFDRNRSLLSRVRSEAYVLTIPLYIGLFVDMRKCEMEVMSVIAGTGGMNRVN